MRHWYTNNPSLLEHEKVLMAQNFPQFTLEKLDNDDLCWVGELSVNIGATIETPKKYIVSAVYANNYPEELMAYPIRGYPTIPDVSEIVERCGEASLYLRPNDNPYGLGSLILRDSSANLYVATIKEDKMNQYSVVKELRYFECWMQICECICAMRLETPSIQVSWESLTTRYIHLENYISERIYGKI